MANLDSFIWLSSLKFRGSFTIKNNWQPDWGYSSKRDNYLPEIKVKYVFLSHLIAYNINYLNNTEAKYLIFIKW